MKIPDVFKEKAAIVWERGTAETRAELLNKRGTPSFSAVRPSFSIARSHSLSTPLAEACDFGASAGA